MASATTTDIDEIRRKMARIRRELHEDMRGVVESAEAVSDWRSYVARYPWASVGLALAVGYFVVPKRRRTVKPAEVAQAVVAQIPEAAQVVAAAEPPKKKGRGLIGAGLGLLAPVVLRAAQNYATHFVSTWIAQRQGQLLEMMAAAGMGGLAEAMGPGPMGPGAGHQAGPGMGQAGGPAQTQGGTR